MWMKLLRHILVAVRSIIYLNTQVFPEGFLRLIWVGQDGHLVAGRDRRDNLSEYLSSSSRLISSVCCLATFPGYIYIQ